MRNIPSAIAAAQSAYTVCITTPSFAAKVAYIRALHDGCRALRSLTAASRRRVLKKAQKRIIESCMDWNGDDLLPLQLLCLCGEPLPGIPSSYPKN